MKILIFGIVASGKTTLAGKLSAACGIPCYEGDCITWGFPGEKRYKRSPGEQAAIIHEIDQKGDWIIEGTYRESQKSLFDLADSIIFLDPPLRIRKIRIVKRFIKQKLGLEKSHYKPTLEMLHWMFKWTADFEKNRSGYEEMLLPYRKKLIRARSEAEALSELDVMTL